MRSPTPVGVMISSASTAPVNPWASPSRSPAKITPLADGMTTFQIRCRGVAMNALLISSSERGVLAIPR